MDKPEEDSNGSKLWAFENLLAWQFFNIFLLVKQTLKEIRLFCLCSGHEISFTSKQH